MDAESDKAGIQNKKYLNVLSLLGNYVRGEMINTPNLGGTP